MDLKSLIAECEDEARRHGYLGEFRDLTEQDCQWIVAQLGRMPTREEWADAGMRWVGDAHVAPAGG